jgi:hypothetical protein
MVGMVFGSIADRQLTTDAPGGSIEVRVIAPLVGAARWGDRLRLHLDPKDPPRWIEAGGGQDFAVVFDANDKLLLVSNLGGEWLLGAIATSRCPSRRFSCEELDLVARAAGLEHGLGRSELLPIQRARGGC